MLSLADRQRVERKLKQGAQARGYETALWTTSRVADLIEEMLVPGTEAGVSASDARPTPARSLLSGPLFEGLSDDERVALVRGLKLRTFDAGDVVLTEGEPGSSLFLLTAGAVRVFVRNPTGSNRLLDDLGEGDFFGEISILSGRPRNATVTAAALCEMLELDQGALAEIQARYPRVSERLESFSHERAASTEASSAPACATTTAPSGRSGLPSTGPCSAPCRAPSSATCSAASRRWTSGCDPNPRPSH